MSKAKLVIGQRNVITTVIFLAISVLTLSAASTLRALGKSSERLGGDSIGLQDRGGGNSDALAANTPPTGGSSSARFRKYPCQDYNPKERTCGLRGNQESAFYRGTRKRVKHHR